MRIFEVFFIRKDLLSVRDVSFETVKYYYLPDSKGFVYEQLRQVYNYYDEAIFKRKDPFQIAFIDMRNGIVAVNGYENEKRYKIEKYLEFLFTLCTHPDV